MDQVCRTCMRIIDVNEKAISINDSDLREKLEACLPEVILDNVVDPKMCGTCSAALSLSFRFKGMCNEAEKTINSCMENKGNVGKKKPLNVTDLLTLGRREIVEEAKVEEAESAPKGLESLQILSDVASQATKAGDFDSAFVDSIYPSTLPSNWDEEIKSSRIERNSGGSPAKKVVSEHIDKVIESVVSTATKRIKTLLPTKGKTRFTKPLLSVKAYKSNPVVTRGVVAKAPVLNKSKPSLKKELKTKNSSPLQPSVKDIESPKTSTLKEKNAKQLQFSNLNPKVQLHKLKMNDVETLKVDEPATQNLKKLATPKQQKIPKPPESANIDIEVTSESPPQPSNNIASAFEKLLQTPEYQKLLQLQSEISQKLQQFQMVVEQHKQEIPKSPEPKKKRVVKRKRLRNQRSARSKKALEDIKLDLAEINDGVERQKAATVSRSESRMRVYSPDQTLNEPMKEETVTVEYLKVETENIGKITKPAKSPPGAKVTSWNRKHSTCEHCGRVFKYTSHLNVHRRSHLVIKPFKCELCDKSFSLERYLSAHMPMHFSAGNHQCLVCNRYFSSYHILQKHQMTHTGVKPFHCKLCERRFTQRVNLDTHMRTHTGSKDFICFLCNSAFGQKVHLIGHMRTHTGEKPFACDLCPKAFAKSTVLRYHKSLHSLKPFMCATCNAMFKEKDAYERHVKKYNYRSNHTTNRMCSKIYDCGICSKYFISSYSRNRHMKVHVKDLIEAPVI